MAEEDTSALSPARDNARRARSVSARMRLNNSELLQKISDQNREKEARKAQLEDRLRRRQALLRDRLLQKPVESKVAADLGPPKLLDRGYPASALPPRLPRADENQYPGALQPCQADVVLARSRGRNASADGAARILRHGARARSWSERQRVPAAGAGLEKQSVLLERIAVLPDALQEHQADDTEAPLFFRRGLGLAQRRGGLERSEAAAAPRLAAASAAVASSASASRHPCLDMATWKKRNGHRPDAKVFICSGGYFDLRDALIARGWVENPDKASPFFDLQWGMASDILYDSLQPHQITNHFRRNREITTKAGLTQNIRSSRFYNNVDADEFYPRAFDLYDPSDRADFVLDFKLSHVESILRSFVLDIDGDREVTFSAEVVELAVDIMGRIHMDLDDIIDDSKLAKKAFSVTAKEWAVLQQVSLDDATDRVGGGPSKQALDAVINKSASRRLSRPRERPKEPAAAETTGKRRKRRSKAKAAEIDPADVCLSAEVSEFRSGEGAALAQRARAALAECERRNPQFSINGTRNAWIIKPAGKSRGRGIQMMRNLDQIFKATECDEFQWIVQKYIEQPEVPCGYKFDIRQWVLVTSWNPLTVFIWKQPYIRFAGQKYDSSLEDNNQFMHLVNNSIVKYMDGFSEVNSELGTAGLMWFRQQYEEWLHRHYCKRPACKHCTPFLKSPPYTCDTFGVKQEECYYVARSESDDEDPDGGPPEAPRRKHRYEPPEPDPRLAQERAKAARAASRAAANLMGAKEPEEERCESLWDTCIAPQMKDIVLWSLRTVMENVESRKNSVEMFGYDFMVSAGEKPRVWLIEVNSSPAMDYSTHVTTALVKQAMEDTAKLLVDRREDPTASIGEWEPLRHDGERQFVSRPVVSERLELVGKAIERPKRRRRKSKRKKGASKKASVQSTGLGRSEDQCVGGHAEEVAAEAPPDAADLRVDECSDSGSCAKRSGTKNSDTESEREPEETAGLVFDDDGVDEDDECNESLDEQGGDDAINSAGNSSDADLAPA